ncbi:MAG: Asp-tRNA(Asn)/Glu-tRNA(Gln) amidotransferase subunit GatC [Alphaproteobacteria bacterium]|nr:MAG: Asp-tRNA(Asn)/Glu-tRNA(Gln) amidotransferase subunit GatC [Alphaproteobacteria bacterium]
MSDITPEKVRKVAQLIRLNLSAEDVDVYAQSLGKIVDWVACLDQVNTDNVAPLMNVNDMAMPLRDDIVTAGDQAEDVLANATDAQAGYFCVPKVVE